MHDNRRRTFSVLRLRLYLLGKTNDTVHFLKSDTQMEPQAVGIGQFTIAGEFYASPALCPAFAGLQ
jgi:hypothetical protein